jgi:hypothetical protein
MKFSLILVLFAVVQIGFSQTFTSRGKQKITNSNSEDGVGVPDMAIVLPEVQTGFVNAGETINI